MAKVGHSSGESLKNLNLHRRVGDVILAADDMGDAELGVVDHRGECIEIGPVLAPEDRIGQRRAVDMALAPHHIVPTHYFRLKLETPMRLAARRFKHLALGF